MNETREERKERLRKLATSLDKPSTVEINLNSFKDIKGDAVVKNDKIIVSLSVPVNIVFDRNKKRINWEDESVVIFNGDVINELFEKLIQVDKTN